MFSASGENRVSAAGLGLAYPGSMELPTGTIVDSAYKISVALRLGKDGDIYLGEPIAPGPPVMIHILRCALMEGDPGLEIFERAGRELCKFSHEAFPEVVDYGRFMVRPYIVTENIEGRTLAEMLQAGAIESDQVQRVIDNTRDALQAAHSEGMAHGSMSADSVLVTADGEIKIVDLFNRWMTHQIGTGGAEIDTAADLQAVDEIGQLLRTTAEPVANFDEPSQANEPDVVAEAPAEPATALDFGGLSHLPKKMFESDSADLSQAAPAIMLALAEEESDAPPPVLDEAVNEDDADEKPAMWDDDFTPEPSVEMGQPPTVVVHTPDLSPAWRPESIEVAPMPEAIEVAPKPAVGGVRLPPPPQSTVASPALPPAPPKVASPALPPMPTAHTPIQVKLPTPMTQVKAQGAPVPKPQVPQAVPTDVAMDFSDDPMLSPQLQPGYIEFLRRFFPRAGLPASRTDGGEKASSKSLNLLLTCSVALLMLAAVLRF